MNKDISISKLQDSKVNADPEKYFSLFDSHIPSLGKGRMVNLYSIDNVECILKIVAKNPDVSYVVYGDPYVNRKVEIMLPGIVTIDETPENRKAYNINMNFDCIIMNPPWGDALSTGLGQNILKGAMQHGSVVVCLYGENEFFKVKNKKRIEQFRHCSDVTIIKSNNVFGINSRMDACCGLFVPGETFDTFKLINEKHPEYNGTYSWNCDLSEFYAMIYPKAFVDLYKSTKAVKDELGAASVKNGMVNLSNDQFEYFENKLAAKAHANKDVLRSQYSFILNRTAYEHAQDPYFETVKNAGGITWTCRTECIKNNMKYWLRDSPLTFLWRKFHLDGTTAHCSAYKCLPAVNFDMPEPDFKEWADSLANNFGKNHMIEEIIKLRFG